MKRLELNAYGHISQKIKETKQGRKEGRERKREREGREGETWTKHKEEGRKRKNICVIPFSRVQLWNIFPVTAFNHVLSNPFFLPLTTSWIVINTQSSWKMNLKLDLQCISSPTSRTGFSWDSNAWGVCVCQVDASETHLPPFFTKCSSFCVLMSLGRRVRENSKPSQASLTPVMALIL